MVRRRSMYAASPVRVSCIPMLASSDRPSFAGEDIPNHASRRPTRLSPKWAAVRAATGVRRCTSGAAKTAPSGTVGRAGTTAPALSGASAGPCMRAWCRAKAAQRIVQWPKATHAESDSTVTRVAYASEPRFSRMVRGPAVGECPSEHCPEHAFVSVLFPMATIPADSMATGRMFSTNLTGNVETIDCAPLRSHSPAARLCDTTVIAARATKASG